jgi:hypothetical protein
MSQLGHHDAISVKIYMQMRCADAVDIRLEPNE